VDSEKQAGQCCRGTRDAEPAVEWTWDGNDELDPAQGQGWTKVSGEELRGMMFFHAGDDSACVASKSEEPNRKTRKLMWQVNGIQTAIRRLPLARPRTLSGLPMAES
jgi:hypothetical protein